MAVRLKAFEGHQFMQAALLYAALAYCCWLLVYVCIRLRCRYDASTAPGYCSSKRRLRAGQ